MYTSERKYRRSFWKSADIKPQIFELYWAPLNQEDGVAMRACIQTGVDAPGFHRVISHDLTDEIPLQAGRRHGRGVGWPGGVCAFCQA